MVLCRATKANGESCTLSANDPQGLCWAHDPANREQRRRLASRAAKSKRDTPRRQIRRIAEELGSLYASVLSGDVQPKAAAVAAQVANARIRALDTERKLRRPDAARPRDGGRRRPNPTNRLASTCFVCGSVTSSNLIELVTSAGNGDRVP